MQKFWQDKKTHLYIWEVTNVFFLHFFFTKLFQKDELSLGVMTFSLPPWWCQDKTKCKPYLFPSSLWSDEPVEQVQVDLLAKDARDVLEAGPEIKYCQCLLWNISEWRLLSCCLLLFQIKTPLLASLLVMFTHQLSQSKPWLKSFFTYPHSCSQRAKN